MNPEIIITERLRLIRVTPELFADLFENCSDEEVMQLLGFRTIEDLHLERERFQKGMTTFNKKFLYFHIIDKATDTLIGWCGFHTWYLHHTRAEIGYGLFSDEYKNKGLMTEAIQPIIEYGFTQMGLHRIEAFISPENIPSLLLVKKLRFQKEGLLRQHYQKDGKMEDSAVFSLLQPEYYNNND